VHAFVLLFACILFCAHHFFCLPGGGKALRRRFRLDDPLRSLFDFVRVEVAARAEELERARGAAAGAAGGAAGEAALVNFAIERSYPRCQFEEPVDGGPQPTLQELELADAALFVRDIDA
jgi:hypothetical protein